MHGMLKLPQWWNAAGEIDEIAHTEPVGLQMLVTFSPRVMATWGT